MKFVTAAICLILAPLVSAQSINFRPPSPTSCAAAGVRVRVSSRFGAGKYTRCCPGLVPGSVPGKWGKFCLDGPASNSCYKAGERSRGGRRRKPCCEGSKLGTVAGKRGKFCVTTYVEPTQPTPTEPTPTEPTPTVPTPTEPTPTEPTPTVPTPTEPTPTVPMTTVPTTTVPMTTVSTTTLPTPTGPCEGLNSQRPHLLTISNAAWSRYESAVLALKASGVWDSFVSIHSTNAGTAHGGSNFLVWHRAYLWELELELDAAVPGARIPWYDWSSVNNPLTSAVWAANRLGSANTNGAAVIQNGPFQGFDSQLTRDGDVTIDIPDRQFILDGINGGLDYAAFNNWLEVLHGAFHVAVGGSMGRIPPAPRDPVFFTHHAYVDAIYREWQNAGGGNQFTGTHSGIPVNAQTVMEPFGRQAGGILAGISSCVSYVGGGSTISRQVEFGGSIAVAQGAVRGGDGDIVKKITKETKRNLQLLVAEKKIRNPASYKLEVKEAVEKIASVKKAALEFGISPGNVVAFEKTMAVLKLQNGIDIAEPEVVDESDAEVKAQGEAEVSAIETGRDDLIKPSKLLEGASNTVTTSE